MLTPQSHRLPINPILRRQHLHLPILLLSRHSLPFQNLHLRLVRRPYKVNDTIPRPFPLLSRRRYHTMPSATQHTVGVFDCCVAEVDNGAATFGRYPEPFSWDVGFEGANGAGGGGPDLEPAEPVH